MWELDEYRVVADRTVSDLDAARSHGMSEKIRGLSKWGKRDILGVAGAALFVTGVGIAAWVSNVGVSMLLVGILMVGIAVNERLVSWASIGVLGAYLTVTASVLFFQVRGDASDLGVNWLGHISWFFRVVGVTVSLPILGYLWLIVSERRKVYSELPSEHPPSDLTAAGRLEIRRWRGFRAHLESPAVDEQPKSDYEPSDSFSLMTYSVALNRARLWGRVPERQVPKEPPSDLAAAVAESWRKDKPATVVGFVAGAYLGSYIYPGEGLAERIFDFSEFSATFGAFGGGGGDGGPGGGDGEVGGGGDFGGGDGGGFDISF